MKKGLEYFLSPHVLYNIICALELKVLKTTLQSYSHLPWNISLPSDGKAEEKTEQMTKEHILSYIISKTYQNEGKEIKSLHTCHIAALWKFLWLFPEDLTQQVLV